jgi:hypothetical protein
MYLSLSNSHRIFPHIFFKFSGAAVVSLYVTERLVYVLIGTFLGIPFKRFGDQILRAKPNGQCHGKHNPAK